MNPFDDLIKVLIAHIGPQGEFSIGRPVLFERVEQQGVVSQPTIMLQREEAQALMDSLWDCGIRPTEGSGSAGAMAAVQKHLEDMRTLVFKSKP